MSLIIITVISSIGISMSNSIISVIFILAYRQKLHYTQGKKY